MKKLFCILITVVFLVSLSSFSFAQLVYEKASDLCFADDGVYDASPETKEIIDLVKTFFETNTIALYMDKQENADQLTILQYLINGNYPDIELLAERYPSVRITQRNRLYTESSLDSGKVSSFTDNLKLHKNIMQYYSTINNVYNLRYDYVTPSYYVISCHVMDKTAFVDFYENVRFKYSTLEEESFDQTHYYVSLFKIREQWKIAAIESDDLFFRENKDNPDRITTKIDGLEGLSKTLSETKKTVSSEVSAIAAIPPSTGITDRSYNRNNAVNYAKTYSTVSDNGNSIPSYRNTEFYFDSSSSCQLFSSQCVWAGLRGSNAYADIQAKQGMDNTGSYIWWSTKTDVANTWSWTSCSCFRNYLNNVKSSSTESGIIAEVESISYTTNDLSAGKFTSNDLLGAVLHVENGDHSVFVTIANGTNRGDIYYTSYNNCQKNICLASHYPAGTAYSASSSLYVIVPRYYRGATSDPSNYLYGDLLDQVPCYSTKTITGRSVIAVGSLKVRVYNPSGTLVNTVTKTNAYTNSFSQTFNAVGTWRIVVSGTGLPSFSFTVRVV